MAASAASAGISSMIPGTSSGSIVKLRRRVKSDEKAADWLAFAGAFDFRRHGGARTTYQVDNVGARWVQADALDLDGCARRSCGERHPECRAGNVSRDGEADGMESLTTLDGHAQAGDLHLRTERRQRALGMIPGRSRLVHDRPPLGLQARENDGAFDLRARDLRGVLNRTKIGARNSERRMPVLRLDVRPHAREGVDDAPHRSFRQGAVAAHRRAHPVGRQNPRHQTHGRA